MLSNINSNSAYTILKKKLIKRYNITIDSKSGYSGAGKNYLNKFRHKNFYQSAYAYAVTDHRHTSEIDQQFERLIKSKVHYTFNPHLIPTFRRNVIDHIC